MMAWPFTPTPGLLPSMVTFRNAGALLVGASAVTGTATGVSPLRAQVTVRGASAFTWPVIVP